MKVLARYTFLVLSDCTESEDAAVKDDLGGYVSEAEENLADLLPEGYSVSVREETPE